VRARKGGALSVHPSVLRGFGDAAERYERARPDYPVEAVAWLAEQLELRPGRTVVDLAAGTGKLTRMLVPTGARVIAVEPVAGMRAQLEQAVPEVETITAYAERMPFEDSSVDAVTSAQAFHWFATEEALDEIARLLRSGGRLGLVWNSRDPEDPIQQVLTGLIEPLRTDEHTHVTKDWREVVEAHARFGPIEEREFDHEQVLTADGLADRILSISFVAVLPPERQAKVAEQARSLAGSGEVRIRYVTTAYITPRLD
jgi:ubiquinone/menaquinone biosynthesis C-methylase UbiE